MDRLDPASQAALARVRKPVKGLLQDLVTRQAERRPAASALVQGSERMTYGELEAASNRLARVLREAGCRAGDRVCFLAPKTPATLAWMVAILKAGCLHVPLDAASPPARLRRIFEACEPRVLLAAGPVHGLRRRGARRPFAAAAARLARSAGALPAARGVRRRRRGARCGELDHVHDARAGRRRTSCSLRGPPACRKAWSSRTRT